MSETKTVQPCGTNGGYQRHRKSGETPCAACREAKREYQRTYRASSESTRDREYRYSLARHRAIERLIRLHPAQFDALLADERART